MRRFGRKQKRKLCLEINMLKEQLRSRPYHARTSLDKTIAVNTYTHLLNVDPCDYEITETRTEFSVVPFFLNRVIHKKEIEHPEILADEYSFKVREYLTEYFKELIEKLSHPQETTE